jgi:hypothetical protein
VFFVRRFNGTKSETKEGGRPLSDWTWLKFIRNRFRKG